MARSLATHLDLTTTAGRMISEDELRVAAKCLELHSYSHQITWLPITQATRRAIELINSHRLRKGDHNLDFWKLKYYQEALSSADIWIEDDLLDTPEARDIAMMDLEIEKCLNPSLYRLIWPPDRLHIQVSKTPVEIHLSSLYQSRESRDIHILDISPYQSPTDFKNDPSVALKIKVLKDFQDGAGSVTLHQFGWVGSNPFYRRVDENLVTKRELLRVGHLVQAIEAGYHWPTNPCPDTQCAFRDKCFPRK